MDVGAQSSEIKTLQRRLDLLSRKEARLQVSQNFLKIQIFQNFKNLYRI